MAENRRRRSARNDEAEHVYQDTSYQDTSYQDASYQDTSYQDASYQDMAYQDAPRQSFTQPYRSRQNTEQWVADGTQQLFQPSSVQPFQSAQPEDPDAEITFVNEEAWQPTFDEEEYADEQPEQAEAPLDDLTEEEEAEMTRTRWRFLANFGSFISVAAGCGVILVLVMMLVSLLNWLYSDVTQSIALFRTMI